MTKKEKFDVAVAAFEAFLKRENAYGSYFREWEVQNEYQGTANVFYAWREWAKRWDPSLWIQSAFTWSKTNQGIDFWYTRQCEWVICMRENLKK